MRPIRLLSLGLALGAALLVVAATPAVSRQASLRADDALCTGTGKDCQFTHTCTQLCEGSTSCCSYTETHTYYPAAE